MGPAGLPRRLGIYLLTGERACLMFEALAGLSPQLENRRQSINAAASAGSFTNDVLSAERAAPN
jgi:hypothetical protein